MTKVSLTRLSMKISGVAAYFLLLVPAITTGQLEEVYTRNSTSAQSQESIDDSRPRSNAALGQLASIFGGKFVSSNNKVNKYFKLADAASEVHTTRAGRVLWRKAGQSTAETAARGIKLPLRPFVQGSTRNAPLFPAPVVFARFLLFVVNTFRYPRRKHLSRLKQSTVDVGLRICSCSKHSSNCRIYNGCPLRTPTTSTKRLVLLAVFLRANNRAKVKFCKLALD